MSNPVKGSTRRSECVFSKEEEKLGDVQIYNNKIQKESCRSLFLNHVLMTKLSEFWTAAGGPMS